MRFFAEFRLAAEPGEVSGLRRAVRERLGPIGLHPVEIDRLVLVLDEIVSNAVEHGGEYRGARDVLMVRVLVDRSGRVDVEFHDPSVPAQVAEDIQRQLASHDGDPGRPPLHHERGRGLFLVAEAFESLQIDRGPDGRGLLLRGTMRRGPA